MSDLLIVHEPLFRSGIFVTVLLAFALLEARFPRRPRRWSRRQRWPANLALTVINTLVVRVSVPITTVAFALYAETRGWGLLGHIAAPRWLAIAAGFILLDFVIYWQHRLFHAVPWLWRLHRMHHADTDFDVTTGIRFHPLEILLSTLIKFTAIALIGPPAMAVAVFAVVLSATSLFNHANLALPCGLERHLRRLVVTPDMHRVHHSVRPDEHHRNFGFNLPWWDHLFLTYRGEPAAGQRNMDIGLALFRDEAELGLARLLVQPFRSGR